MATEHGRPAPQRVFWEWCRSAPAAGSGLAMNNIGGLYEEGDGVPQDYTKAKEWFGKAAASGDPLAEKLARQYLANLTVQGH